VSFQTVSSWLGGRAIPRQEKLRALAELLDVEPQTLHYGSKGGKAVREPAVAWPVSLSEVDRLAIVAYLELPPAQRKLLRDLISNLQEAAKPNSR
jgi:transcriptional regulator with XRE-family HTH domain